MVDLAELPFDQGTDPPAIPTKPRPHRHVWVRWMIDEDGVKTFRIVCEAHAVPVVRDEAKARRGKSSRRLGHDGERRSEKRYGWRKVGEFGGITDLEGTMAIVQQKTSRRAAPSAWLGIFGALAARAGGRIPLILLSFVKNGMPTEDFVLIRGSDWLALHGRDEPPGGIL